MCLYSERNRIHEFNIRPSKYDPVRKRRFLEITLARVSPPVRHQYRRFFLDLHISIRTVYNSCRTTLTHGLSSPRTYFLGGRLKHDAFSTSFSLYNGNNIPSS